MWVAMREAALGEQGELLLREEAGSFAEQPLELVEMFQCFAGLTKLTMERKLF